MLLFQIINFLLEVAAGLLGGACLLRLLMQFHRVPFHNPVGRFIFALTDWLVLPLRRAVPALGRIDSASAVAALLLQVLKYLVIWGMIGTEQSLPLIPLLALFGTVAMAISTLSALLIVCAVLSWVPARSDFSVVIDRLCEPLLAPVRRVVPLIGGVDLSPLVLLVALHILTLVLEQVQRSMMH